MEGLTREDEVIKGLIELEKQRQRGITAAELSSYMDLQSIYELDGGMNMKTNLELILLVINWVIVAIQAFTIFLYGNSIGLFIIMLLALIVQVFSVYDNRKKSLGK